MQEWPVGFLDLGSRYAPESNHWPIDPALKTEPCGAMIISITDTQANYADSPTTDNTYSSSNESPTSTQTTWTPLSDRSSLEVVIDVAFAKECLQRINILADVMGAHYLTLSESEARTKRGLNELWQQHPDIRRRGLLGGTARRQARHKKFVSIGKIPTHERARRIAVEQKDYAGRDRLAGIAKARELFEMAMWNLREQQRKCEQVFAFEHKYMHCEAPWKEAQTA